MSAWSAALFTVVRSHYVEFRLQRFDLGNMVQAVWSTAEGRPLEMTLGTGEQVERLASHFDPILALLAPLWLLAPTPLTLAAVQIAACALGALPVFWLGRRHLGSERSGALLALTYLAYPWLAWTALDAMHPVTLAIPLFLYAIWSLDSDRLGAFALSALLILGTGELMGLPLAALGLWFWLARGRRRAGVVIAFAAIDLYRSSEMHSRGPSPLPACSSMCRRSLLRMLSLQPWIGRGRSLNSLQTPSLRPRPRVACGRR